LITSGRRIVVASFYDFEHSLHIFFGYLGAGRKAKSPLEKVFTHCTFPESTVFRYRLKMHEVPDGLSLPQKWYVSPLTIISAWTMESARLLNLKATAHLIIVKGMERGFTEIFRRLSRVKSKTPWQFQIIR
jgi:hypothetical protein